MQLLAVILAAVVGGVGGALAPRWIARLPEPDDVAAGDLEIVDEDVKELYADLAALPRLSAGLAFGGVVIGAYAGGVLGWHGVLLPWLLMVPVGLLLALVDWRTRYLPSAVIWPAGLAVAALAVVGALLDHHPAALLSAVVGGLGYGAFMFVMYVVSRGQIGFGDVRLCVVLGVALGVLGYGALIVGAFLGLVLTAPGMVVVAAVRTARYRRTHRDEQSFFRTFLRYPVPYGPFLLLGSAVGLLAARV